MATKIFSKTASELDGSNESASTDLSNRNNDRTLLYVNDLDVDVTVDAKLSHSADTDMSDAHTANSQDVASGESGVDTLLDDVWERIGVEISFSSTPSSGELAVYLMEEPSGGS